MSPYAKSAPLDTDAVRQRLVGLALGQPMIYRPVIDSTNTEATSLARAGATNGTLVITDEQPAGRGRIGRTWRSLPRQQLLCSLVLRPLFPAHFLVMAAALAVAGAIEAVAGVRVDVKWPNDVLHDGRKLCGILIETGSGDAGAFAVLGIGINVNGTLADDPELGGRAATLAEVAGHEVSREELATILLQRLDALYAQLCVGGVDAQRQLRAAWRARLVTLGTHVRIVQRDATLEGLAEDVDEGGALLLRDALGAVHTVFWGEVH